MPQVTHESPHGFWSQLVEKNCSAAGLREPAVTRYMTGLVEDFSHTDRLYRVQNRGRTLSSISDLLAFTAAWTALPAQQRALRQYIGDFSLFMSGLFPESIGASDPSGSLPAYIRAGRACYHAVSQWRQAPSPHPVEDMALSARPEVFALMASEFERCVRGLNLVRDEVVSFQDPLYQELERQVRRLMDDPA